MILKHSAVKYFFFYCVGCKHQHTIMVDDNNTGWSFNGNFEKPTFTPSLLNTVPELEGNPKKVCHLFVTDGKLIYQSDCTHEFANRTVDMKDF